MKKLLTILLLAVSSTASAQWFGVTGTAQKNLISGKYRWNFGVNGIFDPILSSYVDSIANLKVNKTVTVAGKPLSSNVTLTKVDVLLPNVDNTSDLLKPVSTATLTALNLKANTNSPSLTGIPLAPTATAGTNNTQLATTAYVTTAVSAATIPDATTLIKGKIKLAGDLSGTADLPTVPALLDKVDKVTGKGLSAEDYTTVDKAKLAGIATGAEVNVNSDWNSVSGDAQILNKPATASNLAIGARTATTLPVTNDNGSGAVLPIATTSLAGLQSSADKTKLDGIATGATVNQTDAFLLARANHTGVQTISTITNLQTALDDKIPLGQKAANNGVATLDASGKVPAAQLPVGSQVYKGTWDASTNTPPLADGTGTAGWTYRVVIGGTRNLGSGNITFSAGDDVIYSGTVWQRIPNASAVASVNGQTGAVVLTKADIALGNVDNTTDLLKPVSTATQTALNLKENSANKSTAALGTSTTLFPTQSAVKTYVDNAITANTGASNLSVGTRTSTVLPIANSNGTAVDLPIATTALSGTLSAADKTKLDGIAAGATANVGTVTSVGLAVPTGMSVVGTPVTGAGTLTLGYSAGYSLPTVAKQTDWDTAFGWGNHSTAGYTTASNTQALTNKSGNITQWTNDANYITSAALPDLSPYALKTGVGSTGNWPINAATATTATNWGSYTNQVGALPAMDFAIGRNGTNNMGPVGVAPFRTWLGLGSNAFTSTDYLPLIGGTMTGGLFGTTASFNSNVYTKNIDITSGQVSNNLAPVLGTLSGAFKVRQTTGLYGLASDVLANGSTWIQAGRFDGTATAYNMLLQPSGGFVGIGTMLPATKFHSYFSGNTATASAIILGEYYGALIGTQSVSSGNYAFRVQSGTSDTGGGGSPLLTVWADGKTELNTTTSFRPGIISSFLANSISIGKSASVWPQIDGFGNGTRGFTLSTEALPSGYQLELDKGGVKAVGNSLFANVTATSFNGPLNGNATTATTANDPNKLPLAGGTVTGPLSVNAKTAINWPNTSPIAQFSSYVSGNTTVPAAQFVSENFGLSVATQSTSNAYYAFTVGSGTSNIGGGGTVLFRIGADGTISLNGKQVTTSSENSAWATTITNNGTTNAHGLNVNIGSSSTGVPFRVDKGGVSLFNIANSGVSTFANSVTASSFIGPLTGNATTATTLQTARTINGVSFNGSADITLPASPSDLALGATTATTQPITNTNGTGLTLPAVTTTLAGLMTSADKVKLNGIATGATANTGTVTSVASTVGGNALNVPATAITTAGTLAYTWAGTAAQYVNGAGNLTTFPTIPAGTVTSVSSANGNISVATGTTTPVLTLASTITSNTTGSAATLTTPRTINGVSFNGSANITVADDTKLPTAGGEVSGILTVKMNNPSASVVLDIGGYARAQDFIVNSDSTLKTNIQPLNINNTINNLKQLQGYSYDWKRDGTHAIGVIAQEVQKVYPEIVFKDSKGILNVDYSKLVAPLIQANNEQQKQIDQLKKDIEELKTLIKR